MRRIILDAEAGQVSTERSRHGFAAHSRVHVRVDILEASRAAHGRDRQSTGRAFGVGLPMNLTSYLDADLAERTA